MGSYLWIALGNYGIEVFLILRFLEVSHATPGLKPIANEKLLFTRLLVLYLASLLMRIMCKLHAITCTGFKILRLRRD